MRENTQSYNKINIVYQLAHLAADSALHSIDCLLTYCILVDSSTVICWTSPFVILWVSGLFCCFYSIFDGKSC